MDRYSKLKVRTLKVFAFAPGTWFTPREVGESLNFIPKRAVWTYLKRLWKFGLLERDTSETGTLKYKLSEGGAARFAGCRGFECPVTGAPKCGARKKQGYSGRDGGEERYISIPANTPILSHPLLTGPWANLRDRRALWGICEM